MHLSVNGSGDNMTICGTPNFIAPEILANDAAYSEAVDMWSLGCILYCFLVGKAPFEGRKVRYLLICACLCSCVATVGLC